MNLSYLALPLLLALGILSPLVFGQTHFTEVYENQGVWQVDHFQVERNKLQDLVISRSFLHESQARHFATEILSRNEGQRVPEQVSTEDVNAAPLWTVTQSWNRDWENKYAVWVEQNLTLDFFVKYDIATDCADVVYALRWIFSRIHGLPASATLGGTGTVVTQDVYRSVWKNLPSHSEWNKDKRFMAALNWLLDAVYTGTLKKDSYPVNVGQESIQPGLIYLLGSHAEIVGSRSFDPGKIPLTIMSSSVPRAVRMLTSRVFMDKANVPQSKGGFVRFLWPVKAQNGWKITPKESMPLYSLEQYRKDLCAHQKHFAICVFEKLSLPYDPATIMRNLTLNLEETIRFRDSVVSEGHAYCKKTDCTPGTDAWENWSTPSRDGRLKDLFENTQDLSRTLNQEKLFSTWLSQYRPAARPASFKLSAFKENLKNGLISFDPRDSLSARWGDHTEGLLESVNAKYRDGEISRAESLDSASACRLDAQACREDRESLSKLSSLDIDFYIRNLLSNWMKYCLNNSCPVTSLNEAFQKIWYQSPAPWDPISVRIGNNVTQGLEHIVLADDIERAFNHTLILNKTRLYSLKTKTEFKTGAFAYDQQSQKLLGVQNGEGTLYDENFRELEKISLPSGQYAIHNFSNGHFFIFTSNSGYLLNTHNWNLSSKYDFQKVIQNPHDRRSIILHGPNSQLLSAFTNQVSIITLGQFDGVIQEILPYQDQSVIVTLQGENENSVGFLSESGFEAMLSGEDSTYLLSRINSSYVQIQDASISRKFLPTLIFNMNKELWRPAGYYSASVSVGPEKRIVFEANFNERLPYLFNEGSISRMNFSFQSIDPIISATSSWLSIQTNKNYSQIIDFNGKEISRSTFYVRGKCASTIFTAQCQGSHPDLTFENYIRHDVDPDAYLNLTRYGLSKTEAIKEVMVYGIGVFSEEREQPKLLQVRGGSAILLTSGVSLWYPN